MHDATTIFQIKHVIDRASELECPPPAAEHRFQSTLTIIITLNTIITYALCIKLLISVGAISIMKYSHVCNR